MTSSVGFLRRHRADVEEWLASENLHGTVSASRHLLHREVKAAISEFAQGRVLEAGAGYSPFRQELSARTDCVVTLDVDGGRAQVDIVGDIQHLHFLDDASFDTVLCTQVLEHVALPGRAVSEMARVLRPGGYLIVSAPHLSMVHEAPNDFYRFTAYGLTALSEAAGLEPVRVIPVGGWLAFAFHHVSLGLWTLLGWIRPLRWGIWLLNYAFLVRLIESMDRALGMRSTFPTDHLLVAIKSVDST